MHLEHSLALLYRQGFRIYSCMNSKVYTVEVEGTPITFVGPSDNRIIVPNRNKESELYYKIVAGLMFDHLVKMDATQRPCGGHRWLRS